MSDSFNQRRSDSRQRHAILHLITVSRLVWIPSSMGMIYTKLICYIIYLLIFLLHSLDSLLLFWKGALNHRTVPI